MNKAIVVTSASKGIGKAIVHRFAESGFDIIICSRSLGDLQELKKQVESKNRGVAVHISQTDMSIKAEVQEFSEFIASISKSIEVLVNNTGVFIPGMIHSEPEGNLELMINTNLYSAYYLTRGLLPGMLNARHGHIFNICSIASITAYAHGGSYSISKFAMLGMTKVLREELKGMGIRVTAVLPGATLTASWEGVDLPESRFMKPEDVADSVYGAYRLSPNSVVEEIIIRPQEGDI